MKEKTLQVKSLEQTIEISQKMGENLRGGECIEFKSDLGGGKTTFTTGLVAGLGSTDQVSSPTFTISNQYDAGDITIHHYDFYRVQDDPGLVRAELDEDTHDGKSVVIVEWAESVEDVLSEQRIVITIQSGENEADREFTFYYPESLDYVFEGIEL